MQNLIKEDIQQHAVFNEQSVEIRVALPLTPLKTQQWAEQFCETFHYPTQIGEPIAFRRLLPPNPAIQIFNAYFALSGFARRFGWNR